MPYPSPSPQEVLSMELSGGNCDDHLHLADEGPGGACRVCVCPLRP